MADHDALLIVFQRALSWQDRAKASEACKVRHLRSLVWLRASRHSLSRRLQAWAKLVQHPSVWQLDLRDTLQPEEVLASLPRLPHTLASLVQCVSLQFATEVQDAHLRGLHALRLRQLDLNACHRWAQVRQLRPAHLPATVSFSAEHALTGSCYCKLTIERSRWHACSSENTFSDSIPCAG